MSRATVSHLRLLPVAIASLLLTLLYLAESNAQPKRGNGLDFLYSYNVFAYNDTTSLVELAYQFSNTGLTYHKQEDGSILGKLYLRLRLRSSPAAEPVFIEGGSAVQAPDPDAPPQPMLGMQLVSLAPGNYQAQLYVEDVADPSRNDSIEFMLKVPSFRGDRIRLSDIEIATDAYTQEDPANPFYKNGHIVLPNISSIVREPFLVMNSYLEIYNADKITSPRFQFVYQIADSTRKLIYHRDDTLDRVEGNGIVKVDMFPLDQLPSGEYYLIAKVYNGFARSSTDSSMVFRRFVVLNPTLDRQFDSIIASRSGKSASNASFSGGDIVDPFYAGMDNKLLDQEWKKVSPLSTVQQRNIWEKLTKPDAKAQFLTQFWASKDPTPGTPANEERELFEKRVQKAANLFRGPSGRKGWDSDRGRVLLQYGEPDGRDNHAQDFNKRPYEVWSYNSLGYEFVFVDRTQTGDYTLVHSSAPHELRYENWERDHVLMNKKWTND